MVRSLKIAVLAGCAVAFSAVPVFAQEILPGLDLDPFHIFTPAPPPAAPPSAVVVVHHHHHIHHHHHLHHHLHHGAHHAAKH